MIDNLDFQTIMDILKLLGVAIGILTIIKQRSEVIIAKFKQNKAEDKADELETVIRNQEQRYEYIGETMLRIVQASKMSVEDKTKATEDYLKLKNEIPEVVKTVAKETVNKDSIKEAVEEIKGLTSGIIKRE